MKSSLNISVSCIRNCQMRLTKEIPFQYDLDNPVVESKFQSKLFKIVKHYDSLTIAEEAEAVKILMGKINIPNVYNWIPIFNEMATGCDVSIPVTTVDDFRFVLSTCFEDARRSRARTISYRWAVTISLPRPVMGTSRLSRSKRKLMVIHQNLAVKHLVFPKLSLFYATFVVRTFILPPIVIRELQSSLTIKTVLLSVRRPMVG